MNSKKIIITVRYKSTGGAYINSYKARNGNIIFKEEWYEYILPVFLFLFGPLFIYNSYSIRRTKVNVFNYYHGKRNK